jgi:hypothetical protein
MAFARASHSVTEEPRESDRGQDGPLAVSDPLDRIRAYKGGTSHTMRSGCGAGCGQDAVQVAAEHPKHFCHDSPIQGTAIATPR